jgi:FkbM family methyltransferase
MHKYSVRDLKNLFFDKVLQQNPEFFVEAGAFKATISKKLSKKLKNTKVLAIEANPYNYNAFKSGFDNTNVTYIHAAISELDGTQIPFYVNKDIKSVIAGNNSIKRKTRDKDYEIQYVNSLTLNTILNMNGFDKDTHKICMWMDLEGAAYEGILSLGSYLENVTLLFVEVEQYQIWKDQKTSSEIQDFMLKHGFTIVGADFQYSTQYNILFEKA